MRMITPERVLESVRAVFNAESSPSQVQVQLTVESSLQL